MYQGRDFGVGTLKYISVFYYNVLGGKIFCSGFFSAAKKILASKIKITEK